MLSSLLEGELSGAETLFTVLVSVSGSDLTLRMLSVNDDKNV